MISDLIVSAANADPTADPDQLAVAVIARVTKGDLTPLVADAIAAAQRAVHRRQEIRTWSVWSARRAASTFTDASVSMPAGAEVAGPLDDFRALYNTPFHLGDGNTVTWGQATIEDHERRIEKLLTLAGGIYRTVERHRNCIEILRSAGATCLAEVEVAA